MAKRLKYFVLLVLGVCLFVPSVSNASIIDVNSVRVTDVTPVQFSVVWGALEPATGSVNVFADADGTTPVTEAVVRFESPDHPAAEDIGVMKVRVIGLKPNTQYFFQIDTTSKSSGSSFSYPDGPPYLDVRTEQSSIVVHNDVLAQQISIGTGKPTQGTLVIAEIDQASYPVTGWASNGVPDGWVAIDMNNYNDTNDHENLELVGGEPIFLTYFGGVLGSVETNDTVPEETGGIQSIQAAATLPGSGSGGGYSSSTSDSSGGGGGGGACFIATASDELFGF
jgi:hypothetical protein